MSSKNNMDPRAQRSREWMNTALLELIEEKGYEKVTITDIADRAGLSRPTFYLHYKSKVEMLVDYLDKLLVPIMEEFHRNRQNAEVDQPGPLAMTKIFEGVQSQIKIYRAILQAGAEELLVERMVQHNLVYLKNLAQRCEKEIPDEVLELSSQFLAGAIVSVLISWIQSDNPYPAEKMGAFITETIQPVLKTVVCDGELDHIFH